MRKRIPQLLFLFFLLSCTEKKTVEVVQDTVAIAPVEAKEEPASELYDELADTLTEEEMTAMELAYEAENSVNTYPKNVDTEGETLRFMEEGFDIGMPFFGDNAVEGIPDFLTANNIKYDLQKTEASKDPDNYESTDTYTYRFDGSRVEIAYNKVTSATIYSPAFEWNTIKIGMDKKDFVAQFPYLTDFYGYNRFQLHIGSFNSACYVQFDFEEDKLVVIEYKIFVQDCG